MKVPIALPVEEEPLPTWEDSVESTESPVDVQFVDALKNKELSLGSVLLCIVGFAVYWYRRMRNK